MCNANFAKSDRGQTIVVFALIVPTLVLFTGLALDVGLLYVTKARLSTAVDAACLTGMKNFYQGTTIATNLAKDIFNANYGANPPTPTVTFPLDIAGNQEVKVTATASVHTLFMQYLSQWATVPVSAAAVSTRGKLVMSLVLDRSGSMGTNGGETALQYAVPRFIANFSNTLDEVAMITFSENSTVDFSMAYNFITPITNKVGAMNPAGGTFGTGAGTGTLLSTTIGPPLSLADIQNKSVALIPGQNVVRVVVYFTDGLMNTVQDNFHCKGVGNNTLTLINYGGCDATGSCDPKVYIFDPTSATANWDIFTPGTSTYFVYDTAGDKCKDVLGNYVTKFTPQQPGKCGDNSTPPCPFSRTNVTYEAQYRAAQTAIAMRTETPVPTYIFTIGMGSGVTTATQAFLAQLANDPSYTATYIKGQPDGLFFYIPSCSGTYLASCKAQLNTAFQTIASKVLLRLTE